MKAPALNTIRTHSSPSQICAVLQLTLLVLLFWSSSHARADSRNVISQGIGYNIGQAAQNAAENALLQSAGGLLDPQQMAENLEAVQTTLSAQSGVITPNPEDYPQGSIEQFEILDTSPSGDFMRVTAKVRVNVSTLGNALQSALNSTPEGVARASSASEAASTPPAPQSTPTPAPDDAAVSETTPGPDAADPADFFSAITQSVLEPIVSAEALQVSVGPMYESADKDIREYFGKLSANEQIIEFLVQVTLSDAYQEKAEALLRTLSVDIRDVPKPEQSFRIAVGSVFGEMRAARNEYLDWQKVASYLASTPAETFHFAPRHDAECKRINDYAFESGIYRGWKDAHLNRLRVEFLDESGQPLLSHELKKTYNYRANPPIAARGVSRETDHPFKSGWDAIALLSSPNPESGFLPDRSGTADNTQMIFSSEVSGGGCPGILITPSTEYIIAAKMAKDMLERVRDIRVSYRN